MTFERIAEWVGRPVYLSRLSFPMFNQEFSAVGLKKSMLMLWFDSDSSQIQKNDLLLHLLQRLPLGLFVAGFDVQESFDLLIDLVSKNAYSRQIMTGMIEETNIIDAINTYLSSAFPAEEDFDYWVDYKIIVSEKSSAEINLKKIRATFHNL